MKRDTYSRNHLAQLSATDRCQRNILRFDFYKQPFRLILPDEKDAYRTLTGACLTALTFVFMLLYLLAKVQAMITLQDYKVQTRIEDRIYKDTDQFSFSQGFMVGAGIPEWG